VTARQFAQLLTAQHGGAARVKPLVTAEFLKLKARDWWGGEWGETQAQAEARYEARFGQPPALLYFVAGVYYAEIE
jgi:hypothetical protein